MKAITLLDKYRRAYILEQEEPEMEPEEEEEEEEETVLDQSFDESEWDDWPEDDQEYYDSLCKEFTFLMENNL